MILCRIFSTKLLRTTLFRLFLALLALANQLEVTSSLTKQGLCLCRHAGRELASDLVATGGCAFLRLRDAGGLLLRVYGFGGWLLARGFDDALSHGVATV